MYKLLLCVRYLKTRYLAFICIVSVMLGVATLIVVNAVMSGFSTKLKDRLHGVLSDLMVDTDRMDGFVDCAPDGRPLMLLGPDGEPVLDREGSPQLKPLSPEEGIQRIKANPVLNDRIEAITPTIEVFAILQFSFRGQTMTKPVRLMGVDPKGRAAVGGFAEYLDRQKNSPNSSFDLTPEALAQHEKNRWDRGYGEQPRPKPKPKPLIPDPFAIPEPDQDAMQNDMPVPQLFGAIPGWTIAHFRYRNAKGQVVDDAALEPGDDITITTVSGLPGAGGMQMKPVWGSFLVTDYIKTEMSEYDQSLVYVPLEQLQRIRGMEGRCTAFQIKLKNYDEDKAVVCEELRKLFPPKSGTRVATWEDNQGSLLAAIDVEKNILNILLFMIVGVAGFSILAIFTMIVSEKYRDIGVLKALGASNHGVLSIFLSYGLLLGVVGCILGSILGLWITEHINKIEEVLTWVRGKPVFPRDIYYFKDIPTNIEIMSVLLTNVGAVAIAVVFSLLPAWRAARLHPVRALRFE